MWPTHKPDTSPDERVKVAAGRIDIGFSSTSALRSRQTAEQNPLSDHDLWTCNTPRQRWEWIKCSERWISLLSDCIQRSHTNSSGGSFYHDTKSRSSEVKPLNRTAIMSLSTCKCTVLMSHNAISSLMGWESGRFWSLHTYVLMPILSRAVTVHQRHIHP